MVFDLCVALDKLDFEYHPYVPLFIIIMDVIQSY